MKAKEKETMSSDSIHNSEQRPSHGLTKREYFAAMAMQGIEASNPMMHPLSGCVS